MRAIASSPALFSSHLTSAPGKPPQARIASPESSTRTGRVEPGVSVAGFRLDDVGGIEGLHLRRGRASSALESKTRAARLPAPSRRRDVTKMTEAAWKRSDCCHSRPSPACRPSGSRYNDRTWPRENGAVPALRRRRCPAGAVLSVVRTTRRPGCRPARSSTASTRSSTRSARAGWARSTRPATSISTRSASSRSRSPTPLGEGSEPRRFQEEARIATLVRHPNVAALYDFSRLPDGSYYMVWEFIDGITLEEWMRRYGPLPASRALDVARQVLAGLAEIHAQGIVHRDLSPDNIMLRREPGRAAPRQDHRPRHRQTRRGRVALR